MSAIHPKITEVLTETFKVPAADITPGATMDSLEMDSLAVAEFAVVIRETLGVDTDAESVLRGATLAGISAFLTENESRVTRVSHLSKMSHAGPASRADHSGVSGASGVNSMSLTTKSSVTTRTSVTTNMSNESMAENEAAAGVRR